jgi:hypothetical protein
MPVLFVEGSADAALRTAREAGWRVHRLEPEDELDSLWPGGVGTEGMRAHAG